MKRLFLFAALPLLLSACAISPAYYYPAPVQAAPYYYGQPYYGQPGAVVVTPAPLYVAPALGLGLHFRGGGRPHH